MDDILKFDRAHHDDYYALLGCDENSTKEQINAEFKVRVLKIHPDKQPDDLQAEAKCKLLHQAKEVLTDPETRKLYDKWRNCGIAVPFEQWRTLSKSVHTSIHWASRKKDLMLEGVSSDNAQVPSVSKAMPTLKTGGRDFPASDQESASNVVWLKNKSDWVQEQGNEVLRKFRNYEL